MRRIAVASAIVAGLLLSGCTSQNTSLDDGWKLIKAQDYAAARSHYQSMLADDPNNPYANLNLGVANEELGDKATAAKHYQAAITNGKDAKIWQVAEDGNVAGRSTTVLKVAEENLAGLGG
ncbi:MAG TPA: tetratricopeptide repeat protein [Thermohalobaculum sp.]|nr:tetratricopeptide repeat protein [Thermohalobaculum sp.]